MDRLLQLSARRDSEGKFRENVTSVAVGICLWFFLAAILLTVAMRSLLSD